MWRINAIFHISLSLTDTYSKQTFLGYGGKLKNLANYNTIKTRLYFESFHNEIIMLKMYFSILSCGVPQLKRGPGQMPLKDNARLKLCVEIISITSPFQPL
jgi:hypothetical protein